MSTSPQRYPSSPLTQADILYNAAADKHRLGNLPAATQLYVQALQADGDYAPALHMLSTMEFQKGNKDSALQGLMHVIDMGYHTPMVWWHLGCVQLALGKAADAVTAFRNALEGKPDDAELRYNLGSAARQAGQLELAISALSMAAHQLKTAAAYHELGLAYHQLGKRSDAKNAYMTALEIDPAHRSAALNAGAIAHEGEDFETAIKLFRGVLKRDPSNIKAAMNLGVSLQEQGDIASALEIFNGILAQSPTQDALTQAERIEALNNLSAGQLRLGQFEAAAQSCKDVLAHDPLHEAAITNYTAAMNELDNTQAGIDYLRALTTTHPHNPKAFLLLGKALEKESKPEEAAAAFKHAVNADPMNAAAHDSLGRVLSQLGDNTAAYEHCKKAATFAPWEVPYQLHMGLVAMRCKDAKTALAAFDDVLISNRFDQQAICYRALALRMLGRATEADAFTHPDDVITVIDLPLPSPDFIETLAEDLRNVRGRIWSPYGQSVRGGTQTQNALFSEKLDSVQMLRGMLDTAIGEYMSRWPQDGKHPFYAGKPTKLLYRSWSVILREGGYHTPHIHPEGCLSGVFYVVVPELNGDEGSLELGKPGVNMPLPEAPPTRRVRPAVGRLILFPSYLWHGTLPFTGNGERITVAFDIMQTFD